MYLVYLFKEKKTGNIIYVGSTARPSARMKEHKEQIKGARTSNKIHDYMRNNNLKLYKDVSVIWIDEAETKKDVLILEEKYYFKHLETVKNERPADNMKGLYNPRRRKVKCLNDNKTFNTITECAKYYGKGRTTISNVLIKEKPYTIINEQKYYFEYITNV